MSKSKEEEFPYKELGEFMNETRLELGITISRLCSDYHMGKTTYANLQKGKTLD